MQYTTITKGVLPLKRITANKLDAARARLILALGHDVEWKQFAEWAGLSPHTISGIRAGRSGGTPETARKIIDMLRHNGVNMLTDDLFETV